MMRSISWLKGRASGILLHPTSLPGPDGIGDLGEGARRFVDFLAGSGQRYWQVLPLGPTGMGNSPYQCLSAMAGNPMLLSLDELAEEGWLADGDLQDRAGLPDGGTDYGRAGEFKEACIRRAAARFFETAPAEERASFEDFCRLHSFWLGPFSRFCALRSAHGGRAWTEWTGREADPAEVRVLDFAQYQFFRQWDRLRSHCRARGVALIGDMPIFVAHDSADVWAHQELFDLDSRGRPRVVAGVPPDYFSATGQLWGNPHYRWDIASSTGFRWWLDRLRLLLGWVDVVRIDHFRGFESYYEVPAGEATAQRGRWVEGPGDAFFRAVREALGDVPMIAEDLGWITPEVDALRERVGLPGMRVLQFAFSSPSPDNPHKPYNYVPGCVAYTGTHDNDTMLGWLDGGAGGLPAGGEARRERAYALKYVGAERRQFHWECVRAVMASAAGLVIFPLQDVLGLGSEARMNLPGSVEGNWAWRCSAAQLARPLASRLRAMTETYGRG